MQSSGRILLVEANGAALGRLEEAAAPFAQVESHRSFATARARLCRVRFDLLVTNVRLGAYNGLHLVYLSASGQGSPRSIVFSNERDAALAQEVQRAGAFYEVGTRLPATLAAYVIARLPVAPGSTGGIPAPPIDGGRLAAVAAAGISFARKLVRVLLPRPRARPRM